jgi:hypothetical protein
MGNYFTTFRPKLGRLNSWYLTHGKLQFRLKGPIIRGGLLVTPSPKL